MDVVALAARDSNLPYTDAVLWIARSDSLVRRIDISETSGQRRLIILSRLRANGTIATREFRFNPPQGVHVVDQ